MAGISGVLTAHSHICISVASELLLAVASILVLGLGAQVLAGRLRVPSVVLYLVLGVILGPEVLGLVTLETFGDGLEIIVGISVATIVFDGAFALRFERVREASTTSLRLITVGAVVMFLGTATAVRFLEGVEWEFAGNLQAGQTLIGTVFIVIFATVAVEAGLARQIGDFLGVTPMRTIIIGGGRVGRALATRLEERGEFVAIVEDDETAKEQSRAEGFTVIEGDGTEQSTLRNAGIDEAKIFVAATEDDNVNLLACQTVNTKYDVKEVYSRVNQPENVAAFDSMDVTAVDDPMARRSPSTTRSNGRSWHTGCTISGTATTSRRPR